MKYIHPLGQFRYYILDGYPERQDKGEHQKQLSKNLYVNG